MMTAKLLAWLWRNVTEWVAMRRRTKTAATSTRTWADSE